MVAVAVTSLLESVRFDVFALRARLTVATEGTSEDDTISLGVKGQAFSFLQDSASDVSCVLCSVPENGAADLDGVAGFVEGLFAK